MTTIDAAPPPKMLATGPGAAIAALFLANVALACGPWMVRVAGTESHIGPLAAAFWRLLLALPVLLAATARSGERVAAGSGALVGLALVAGLLFAGNIAAWHLGIMQTRLANAALMGNVTALLYPAYGFVVTRRWPSRRQAGALACALCGAVLLVGRSYRLSAGGMAGDMLCIGAGFCYTGYLVTIGRVRTRIGPFTVLTLAVAAGIPVLLLGAWALGEPIWPQTWRPVLLLTLGSQIIGQGLIMLVVGRVAPLVVGMMLLVQPIVSAAIGWLGYDERLTALDGLGAIAIGLGVLLVREPRSA